MKAPVAKNDMYGEIRALIASARERVAVLVNAELTLLFWNAKQLRRMVQFANAFPDREIVASLIRQLSWTHILSLIPLDDQRNQEFAQK